MTTVAQHIADYLANKGCTHSFGIVGGANLTLFSEISKRFHVISVCHEQAAAIAAAYFYKVSGRIAPCLVTAGGGAANAITGVVEAHMDGIPLLVISGNEMLKFFENPHSRSIGFQGFNPEDAVGFCTKRVVSVNDAEGALVEIDKCYRIALEHRQGACWYDLPQDVANMEVA